MFTKKIDELNREDVMQAGGKGAFLGELTQKGATVPTGFVVLTSAFEQFVSAGHLHEHINHSLEEVRKSQKSAKEAADELKSLFDKSEFPGEIAQEINQQFKMLGLELVAVRSSATAEDNAERSWAGQLESYLNITRSNLLHSVKKCWASLFSERAIAYRLSDPDNSESIQVAVVVQQMVNPEISGIAFSVNPVSENFNEIIIEAAFGLCEPVVQGEITPDHYVIEKASLKVVDIFPASQERGVYKLFDGTTGWKTIDPATAIRQKLNNAEIIQLAEKVIIIEKIAGFPSDIEWTYDNGQFYFVQCRPITTLNS